ncbi:hypothetical protein HC723_06900 [Vibrio sp. S11_S32]|uniref:DUF6701 domain-containing protein n=1 Tax=Vibrio sp. S11_S32 TaxID=2720225 RepID=UPI0016802647|nr:DUF6701 domain-containing protein [Vibrio sp. S11_S32]MBD1576169.1 hypothetical protein [Vibrio sp. S11_S32]
MPFDTAPDFRYGRMTLDNVSGPQGGSVQVPLRAEYWNGKSFVRNEDDSGSDFDASIYCVMSNVENSSAALSSDPEGVESVVTGSSDIVNAEQANSQREMARIFLRQGDDSIGMNSALPLPDATLNQTQCGDWSAKRDDDEQAQPWLQFNWRNLGDEDPRR